MTTPLSDTDFAAQATQERSDTLQQDTAGYVWHKQVLQPYSPRRELLFQLISRQMGTLPEYERCSTLESMALVEEYAEKRVAEFPDIAAQQCINWALFLPETALTLYLVHHEPAAWAPLRADIPQWIEVIMLWAEENILFDEMEAAARLALRIRTAHLQFIAIPRPERSGGKTGAAAGN